MPGASYTSGGNSDEAPNTDGATFNNTLSGKLGTSNVPNYWPYSTIRRINILFENVSSGSLTSEQVDMLSGQSYFWRAWAYYNLVNNYGGVPLILTPQDRTEGDALFVSRSSTSDCISK